VQERQFPESHSEALAPAERRALQRARAHRLQGLTAGVGAALLALFAIGCPEPADLQNPDAFAKPPQTGGTSSTAGAAAGGAVGGGMECESACMAAIISATCKTCHGAKLMLAGTLDLETPNYTMRLKDRPSEHPTVDAAMCPKGDKLIDTKSPADSWLLKKVSNQQGTCGTIMPSTPPPLTASQLMCVQTYIQCATGGSVPGAAPGGTAGAASGGGGTSGSGGAGGT